jgi:hypothetical protein
VPWCRIIAGYSVSIGAGHALLHPLVDGYLWPRFREAYKDRLGQYPVHFSWLVGIVERALYTTALAIGAWQFVGVWLAIKVAARWRNPDDQKGVPTDNIWLIGTGVSLLFGFLGAWIIRWHLPMLGSK